MSASPSTSWASVQHYGSAQLPDGIEHGAVTLHPSRPPSSSPPSQALWHPITVGSSSPTNTSSQRRTKIPVSTTFYPGATIGSVSEDLVVCSSDGVRFYLNTGLILSASDNRFAGLLPAATAVHQPLTLPETSPVLFLVFCAFYGLPCVAHNPAFAEIAAALDALRTYGLPPLHAAGPGTPLAAALAAHTAAEPLALYALAAAHDLPALAAAASAHLHALDLRALSDAEARAIGAVYLRRLVALHLERVAALKHLLLISPSAHAPTPECGDSERRRMLRAWGLAAAYLSWDGRADIMNSEIEAAFASLDAEVVCSLCQGSIQARVKGLLSQWEAVQATV